MEERHQGVQPDGTQLRTLQPAGRPAECRRALRRNQRLPHLQAYRQGREHPRPPLAAPRGHEELYRTHRQTQQVKR